MTTLSLPFQMPVDAEHGGKRAVGCVSLLIGFLVPLIGIVSIMPEGWLIGIVVGFAVAAAAASLTERLLRGRWPSGRALSVDSQSIRLLKHEQVEEAINPAQHVNAMLYHFVVKRNSRVRKGWHVIVLTLEQDDTYIPVYTFASPEQFEALAQRPLFHLLERPKDESLKSAGVMRRLHTAETYRSMHGAEVTLDEFTRLLNTLQEQFTHWMPKS
ncbi:hypothetical protein VZO05_06990 [Aggregatilineales bacterium SYSU G02658]